MSKRVALNNQGKHKTRAQHKHTRITIYYIAKLYYYYSFTILILKTLV